MTALLQTMGYGVESAVDPKLGLEMFHEERHDLVITDMHMPGMDGLRLTRAIKRISPSTPVIVISGSLVSEARNCDAEEHPDSVLHKPFAFDELSELLIRLLQGSPTAGLDRCVKATEGAGQTTSGPEESF